MIPYYGSKVRLAAKYPGPAYPKIVEPFAGGAGYALLYSNREVLLVDTYAPIVGIWEYLIHASGSEIRSLPVDVVDTETLTVCQEARWLIGYWLHPAMAKPPTRGSTWKAKYVRAGTFWGEQIRERIASQIDFIRHWEVIQASYETLANYEATWFIDPPYQIQGKKYPHRQIDYPALGDWCKGRQGQVIACECQGADWLPFVPLAAVNNQKKRKSAEVVWLAGPGSPDGSGVGSGGSAASGLC